MKNFIDKLMALKGNVQSGVKKAGNNIADLAKGTLENMSDVKGRRELMDETARERNRQLTEDEGETMKDYQSRMGEDDELFQTGYISMLKKLLGELK